MRTKAHFDAFSCSDLRTDQLQSLIFTVEKAITRDRNVSPNAAAKQIDLLNNIDRHEGWDQETALACICTDAQIAAYNQAKEKNLSRERLTRHLKVLQPQTKLRDYLDPENVRLGANTAGHPDHTLGPGLVVDGVKKFRRYCHDVFLRMYEKPLGKKLLFLAWWLATRRQAKKERLNLTTIFSQDAAGINATIMEATRSLNSHKRPRGCFSDLSKTLALQVEKRQKK